MYPTPAFCRLNSIQQTFLTYWAVFIFISYPHIQSTLEKCLSIQMNDVLFCGLAKGGVRIIKMEIQDGICHEGGWGSRVPHTYSEFFFENHSESFPDCENVFCT